MEQNLNPAAEAAALIAPLVGENKAPWQKEGVPFPAMNPVSGKVYRGLNQVALGSASHDDPRWVTLKQANELGLRVGKGERGQKIALWRRGENEGRPSLQYAVVFNYEQLRTQEGEPLPPFTQSETYLARQKEDPNRERPDIEAMLSNTGARIVQNAKLGQAEFYDPKEDAIHLQPMEWYESKELYYGAALEGLARSQAHADRQDKYIGVPGTVPYAREELKVKMATWMMAQELRLQYRPGHAATYAQDWAKLLGEGPYELARVAAEAEKAKEAVLRLQREPDMAIAKREARQHGQEANVDYIKVPKEDWEKAKAMGAKWDWDNYAPYAPDGPDKEKLIARWPVATLGQIQADRRERRLREQPQVSPEEEFRDVLENLGFKLEGLPVLDGQIHRAPVENGKHGAKDGAYQGYSDGRPNGWAENHRTGEKVKWVATGHQLSEAQKEAIRRKSAAEAEERRREEEAQRAEAMAAAAELFEKAPPAQANHPYFAMKGIEPLATAWPKEDSGKLLVPLYDYRQDPPKLQSLQSISPEGVKLYQKHCPKTGGMLILDSHETLGPKGQKPKTILVAEGFATGVTLHAATGLPVAVAFDANNLKAVGERLREIHPDISLTFCADNDYARAENVGLAKAGEAAKETKGRFIAPQFTEEEKQKCKGPHGPSDFNDLAALRGLEAVKSAVETALARQKKESRAAAPAKPKGLAR